MCDVVENKKTLDHGIKLNTQVRRITILNSLEVEAGTTGFMGGDSGHGGRTYFRIDDLGGTDMSIVSYKGPYGTRGFEVTLGGDSELITILEALEFIAAVLREGKKADSQDN